MAKCYAPAMRMTLILAALLAPLAAYPQNEGPNFDYGVAQQRLEPILGLAQRTLRDVRENRITAAYWSTSVAGNIEKLDTTNDMDGLHASFVRYLSQELFDALEPLEGRGAYRTPESGAHEALAREHLDRARALTTTLLALRVHRHQLLIKQDRETNGATAEEYAPISYSKWIDQHPGIQLTRSLGSVAVSFAMGMGAFNLALNDAATEMAAGPLLLVTALTSLGLSGYGSYKLEELLHHRRANREFPAHRAAADVALAQAIEAYDQKLLQSFIAGAADREVSPADALARWGTLTRQMTPPETCVTALRVRVDEGTEDEAAEDEATATSRARARL
jgi:hypothetical protein